MQPVQKDKWQNSITGLHWYTTGKTWEMYMVLTQHWRGKTDVMILKLKMSIYRYQNLVGIFEINNQLIDNQFADLTFDWLIYWYSISTKGTYISRVHTDEKLTFLFKNTKCTTWKPPAKLPSVYQSWQPLINEHDLNFFGPLE